MLRYGMMKRRRVGYWRSISLSLHCPIIPQSVFSAIDQRPGVESAQEMECLDVLHTWKLSIPQLSATSPCHSVIVRS